jgi:ribosomal protein L16/L10AE
MLTSKSQGTRMGKGVGSTKEWVIETKVGQIVVEISWVDADMYAILLKMSKKFPVKVDFVFKDYRY